MELRQLRYFITLANELSFTRAAKLLHVSQPPLSYQIAQLEDELGARLFERTSRIVSLTEAGKALVPHAKAILDRTEEARQDAGEPDRKGQAAGGEEVAGREEGAAGEG